MKKKFKLIAAAGTFDRLHQGHKFFLKGAFSFGERVIIGITSDEFVKNKPLSSEILPFEERKNAVLAFLRQSNYLARTTIFNLDDIYGPAVDKNSPIEAILVTQKTLRGVKMVNLKRKELGLKPLEIIEVDLIKYQGESLSSTNLRKSPTLLNNNFILPKSIRPFLQKPLGKLLKGREENLATAALKAKKLLDKNPSFLIITVGDVVTRSFNQLKIPINLAIVDFKIKRKEVIKNLGELGFGKVKPDLVVNNPPSRVSRSLSESIRRALNNPKSKSPFIIKVIGEEDLAVLPAIILSPNNTVIFYGQPKEGIVYIKVDDSIKNRTLDLLSRFSISYLAQGTS